MEFKVSPAEAAFRQAAREWLSANSPTEIRPSEGKAMADFDKAWQRKLFDGGWAGVSWPVEYGGRGAGLMEQVVWYEECSRAGAPQVGINFIGVNHAGPTLIACANEAQKSFHLPKILRGEAIWCQGFSEPGAGSDLASLQTKAVLDGDELVITGSKIWTSSAHHAQYQELLVRTNATAKKHAGISWVIGDMGAKGIEVRPLTTMDGATHFCEVFYDEVRIPVANVVGGIDEGWKIAMANLGFERATALSASQIDLQRLVDAIIAMAASRPGSRGGTLLEDDDEIRRRAAGVRTEVSALRAMTYGVFSRLNRIPIPGPEGSMVRLTYTQLVQKVNRLAMDVMGMDSLDFDARSAEGRPWVRDYLLSYKETISGGTKDIQRNIIAERILGLPKPH